MRSCNMMADNKHGNRILGGKPAVARQFGDINFVFMCVCVFE